MLASIIAVAASYLLGSISFSILIARWVKGIDIRQHGSGNAGATNTLRVLGKGPAAAVFLLDVAKGIAAVLIGQWLGEGEIWVPILCGAAAITGHNWPIWFRFKGGKGIATTIGVMATLAFWPALLAGIIAIAAIAITRYVSLGSLIFAALLPVFILVLSMPYELFWVSLLICVYAFIRHRTNIVKLVRGQEHKLGAGKGVPNGK
ncbi:acyl-phosphate glycerol 3-phosphate acyltransferase [Thermobacillus composti KWC4]|mgnify:FL=1|uniref:Glycerol-3-phosphate acyltransferase n=1 Tax=Thermobacillus composti (strain DSM 18247 / JCM 13945 / KWC4) TaxID=717605 RepID=L0EEF4_THECK|nr:glycerol-3-phosphate 1-O-acyltransferase PlsY [Thermobacillus composti]AGA57999.1 acyl-phosphate glycerol 3-phosphate acyltransferase [Thermobacillus composti KWC4]REJ13186.1 MAG: acyl-phosphate glycerol 3-phosphate acyltransferase [Paenibacillaceae bacterium]